MDPTTPQMELLESLLRQESVTLRTQLLAFFAAVLLALAVLESVRRRKLREEFTPLWTAWALAFLALALSRDLLLWVTRAIGAWTSSSTIFALGIAFLMLISLSYAIRLSTLSHQVKVLSQELALLRAQRSEEEGRS